MWWPEQALNIVYLVPISLSRISFNGWHLHLISTLLTLAGSRHDHTLPFALETQIKLLHCFNVSPTSRSIIICCFCNLSNSFFRDSLSPCVTLLRMPSMVGCCPLTCKTKCTFKTPNTWKNITEFIVYAGIRVILCFPVRLNIWQASLERKEDTVPTWLKKQAFALLLCKCKATTLSDKQNAILHSIMVMA